jgi:DNA polymerase
MLVAIGVSRDAVYIANTLKCRPPGNRDPKPQETRECSGFLARQIALIRPKVIVAVGRIAANTLLETDEALGRMRGRVYTLPGAHAVPVVVTYHPAYLLRSPDQKPKSWADLKLAREQVQGASVSASSVH